MNAPPAAHQSVTSAAADSSGRSEAPAFRPEPQEIDDDFPLELDDEHWEAFTPDDDYEPHPAPGDFWTDDP